MSRIAIACWDAECKLAPCTVLAVVCEQCFDCCFTAFRRTQKCDTFIFMGWLFVQAMKINISSQTLSV